MLLLAKSSGSSEAKRMKSTDSTYISYSYSIYIYVRMYACTYVCIPLNKYNSYGNYIHTYGTALK